MSFDLGRALGKLAPVLDPRTLRLAKYVNDVPAPPPSRDWSDRIAFDFGIYRNLEIGVCTCAAAAHLQRVWSSQQSGEVVPTEADVISAYSQVSGYTPTDPRTDRGADMLAVLKHWRKRGIAGRQISAFAKVDHDDMLQLRIGCNLFGGLYVGASLPLAARHTARSWDIPHDRPLKGELAVGSWGGHTMAAVGFNRLGVWLVTWGRRQFATWPWFLSYVDEAYVVLDALWVGAERLAPNGFDLATLEQDLGELA